MEAFCKLGLVQVTDSGAGEEEKGAVTVYRPPKPSRVFLSHLSYRWPDVWLYPLLQITYNWVGFIAYNIIFVF